MRNLSLIMLILSVIQLKNEKYAKKPLNGDI